jgi:hypothetical protein
MVNMSEKELERASVLQKVLDGRLKQEEAGRVLGISSRQVRNLQSRYLVSGASGLVSKRRGQPSPNRLSSELKEEAVVLLKAHYRDFGPQLAKEKLLERHGLSLSVESVRQLMIGASLWKGKQRKKAHVHPMRTRRSQFGELVQIDGSPHDWFEGRAPECCLLVFVDDATSRILQCYFVESETTKGYFEATEQYIKRYGRPLDFYSDKHGIFRVNIPEALTGTGETQFGRAMRELEIGLICAHSPQAKGRVERANKTLQDRLVKEMRLEGISSMEAGNAYLQGFIEDYNARFGVEPASPEDAHRKTLPAEEKLRQIFSVQETRKITKNLEVSYKNVIYQIEHESPSYNMRGAMLLVCDNGNQVELFYKEKKLSYKVFNKNNRPLPIVDGKELNTLQNKRLWKPKADHPWRTPLKFSPPEKHPKTASSPSQLSNKMSLWTTH